MLREDRELLVDLRRVCNQAARFAMELLDGDLSVEAEEAYAHQLVDVAEGILRHVSNRKRPVIDCPSVVIEPGPPPANGFGTRS